MHFDQWTQAALREIGLSMDEIQEASDRVVSATRETATSIESFFEGRDVVYSDMDRAHSASDIQEHTVEYIDLYTHAADIRGYLRFDSWGVPVEGGRVLDDEVGGSSSSRVLDDEEGKGVVELTLGPTVHGRVRFAVDPSLL